MAKFDRLNMASYMYYETIEISTLGHYHLAIAFPLFVALLYTGKAAKLKLFITIRESIHIALLRIKFMWYL